MVIFRIIQFHHHHLLPDKNFYQIYLKLKPKPYENYNIIIDKYINRDLDIDDMLFFEKTMQTDSKLRNDYKLYCDINEAILEEDVMMLRGTLNSLCTELEEPEIKYLPNRFKKRKVYYAAASLAMLMATGGIVYQYAKPELNNLAVYEKYYQPYEVSITYRSGNEEIDRILISALEKYEEHDYQNAVILFENVLNRRSDDVAANLYSGISNMEIEKYQKATKSFQTVIADNNNLFIEQAKWYLAMCYIKTDNTDKAEGLLNELVANDSFYKKAAKKVLKDLK